MMRHHTTTRRDTDERERRAHVRDELAARLRADLAAQVAALADTTAWRAYLDAVAAFHTYSFHNTLLILAQCPHATRIAGYRQWQALGRQVRKGEKAIRIYGYRTRSHTDTDPATGEETTHATVSYPILSVFDLSQTDPIQDAPQPLDTPTALTQRLTGDDPHRLFDRTRDVLTGRGWHVERDLIDADANGYTTIDGTRRVVVDARLSAAQSAQTMLHAAHTVLHADPDTATDARAHRGIVETEAESVAYVLAALHGLDTRGYSIGYITGWSNADPHLLAATAHRVLTAVHDLATALDPE